MTAPTRVLIADDHPLVREGLKRVLADEPDLRVVGEAGSGEEVLAACEAQRVDVLVLDISMPGPGFLETLRRLREVAPDVAVLVLSVHPEERYATRALKAGAVGYLTKDRSLDALGEAIRRIRAGGRYVSERLAERLASALGPRDLQDAAHEALSEREDQVLRLLATGRAVKEIGLQLELSPKTVSTYRARLLSKLGLATTADLVRYALEHRLIEGAEEA